MDIKETINDTIVVFKLIFHPQNTTDRLFILGSIEKLGNWNLPDAVELINNKETPNTFTTTIVIPENTFFEYKYYVQRNDVIIEEKLRNRRISSKGFKLLVDDGHFCSEDQSHEEFSAQWVASSHDLRILFGHPQPPDSRGEIFRFFQNKEFKIKEFIVHAHSNKTRIIRNRNIWNDKQSSKDRFLFNENNNRLLHDEFEELTLRTDDFNEFECIFSLFSSNNEKIGTSCITSSMIIKEKCGILALPIISIDGSQILGEMNLEYLLVTPFIHEALGIQAAAAASSSRSFWKSTEYLYCGHRGMGANNAKSKSGKKTIFNENTILSFNTAASIGTQYVEFDVQLTKDNIPVVFHDFSIGIPTLQSKSLHIPIASLTLHELQSLFLDPTTSPLSYPTSPDRCSSPSRISDDYSLERKFYHGLSYAHPNLLSDGSPPSLDDVFRSVNANIGFNIEVKYPSDDEKKRETPTIQERNLFIDKILDVVHAHFTSQRNIFFSSFDPQSCILLSLKQPHYPVFFLTEAGTEITCDPRRNSLLAAAHFAKSHYLLGIVSNVKPILQDPSIISSIKREGLMLITYGGDNNELENIKLQEENGIDAIISDFHLNPRGYFPVFRHQASSATPDELLPTAIQQK